MFVTKKQRLEGKRTQNPKDMKPESEICGIESAASPNSDLISFLENFLSNRRSVIQYSHSTSVTDAGKSTKVTNHCTWM